MKIIFYSALLISLACHGITLDGRIIAVTDGDTVTLLDRLNVQHKIRLAGIDAPEKNQAFGQKSKENLSSLVFDKFVSVETSKKDKYGREIGKILVGGIDANLEQVVRGLAWHYKAYELEQSVEDRRLYAMAESEAKTSKKGLWVDEGAVAPWEFRHSKNARN